MQGYNTIFNEGIISSDFDDYRRKNVVESLESEEFSKVREAY
jgi:hypothetical protein